MLKILKSFFDLNKKQISKTDKPLAEIKRYTELYKDKDFSEFRAEIAEFRSLLKSILDQIPESQKESLKKIDRNKGLPKIEEEIKAKLYEFMPKFYAMINEVYRRKIGITYYDVQFRAGIILAQGQRLVELATGEGKTMTFQLPLFLYALAGRGAHLVTVNDYLSKRDGEYAGHIASELGLSVGIITSAQSYKFIKDEEIQILKGEEAKKEREEIKLNISQMNGVNLIQTSKKEAYGCDITYGTNNEFGFDYLRDNMAFSLDDISQRELYFCVVDEADSILIDEARTPLIISGMPYDSDVEKYKTFANAVRNLEENTHYLVDHKTRSVTLTEEGIKKVEENLGTENLWDDYASTYHISNALKAKALFKRDDKYIVRNGEVLIVDEFTGRILPGRRYSEGLHQAIEAKENVPIRQENKTYATITFQNYFRLYKILTGGSGTIMTEAEEFYKIYGLESVPIPTNKPVIRKDYTDLIFKTEAAKYRAIIKDVQERHTKGQPILIGTASVEKSEIISALLTEVGIEHQVLNAKHHEKEAKIIEKAGSKGAVTVATNMAGRGADIIIGGGQRGDEAYKEVLELGGLHVIGTERHEARRIDNQLRGRTGRQGEPGSSQFYVSMEDQIMKVLGGQIMQKLLSFVKFDEDTPISMKIFANKIQTAQKMIENVNFDYRKNIVEYDDVMNYHREIFYTKRRKILKVSEAANGKFIVSNSIVNINNISLNTKHIENSVNIEKLKELQKEAQNKLIEIVKLYFYELLKKTILEKISENKKLSENLTKEIIKNILSTIPFYILKNIFSANSESEVEMEIRKILNTSPTEEIENKIKNLIEQAIKHKLQNLDGDFYKVTQVIFLQKMDRLWIDHLEIMKDVRDNIRYQQYAQKDPLVEYKNEAFVAFESFINQINKTVIEQLLRIEKVINYTPIARSLQTNTEEIDDISTGSREFFPDPSLLNQNISNEENNERSFSGIEARKIIDKLLKERQKTEASVSTNTKDVTSNQTKENIYKNVGRNDPCPCGSGKKFKKCHGAN